MTEEFPRYSAIVTVRITDRGTCNSNGLSVEEVFDLTAQDFMAMAKILGQFHDLAQEIKKEHP
jgi:hypothetical protein